MVNVILRTEKDELIAEWKDYVPPVGTKITIDVTVTDMDGNTIPCGMVREERFKVIYHAPRIVVGIGYTFVNVFVYVEPVEVQ